MTAAPVARDQGLAEVRASNWPGMSYASVRCQALCHRRGGRSDRPSDSPGEVGRFSLEPKHAQEGLGFDCSTRSPASQSPTGGRCCGFPPGRRGPRGTSCASHHGARRAGEISTRERGPGARHPARDVPGPGCQRVQEFRRNHRHAGEKAQRSSGHRHELHRPQFACGGSPSPVWPYASGPHGGPGSGSGSERQRVRAAKRSCRPVATESIGRRPGVRQTSSSRPIRRWLAGCRAASLRQCVLRQPRWPRPRYRCRPPADSSGSTSLVRVAHAGQLPVGAIALRSTERLDTSSLHGGIGGRGDSVQPGSARGIG